MAEFSNEGTYVPDELVIGGDINTQTKTLVSGQNLQRGAVLGIITASGKLTLSASAAGDGSQVANCILLEDCDASGGDAQCSVYISGHFNENALTFGTGHTADTTREQLRDVGIYIKPAMAR